MSRLSREVELREAVHTLLANSLDAGQALSVREVARALRCSPTLLYKYRLAELIGIAARRARGAETRGSIQGKRQSARISRLQTELEWCRRAYETGLSKWFALESYLREHSELNVDVDAIYTGGLPTVDRSSPTPVRNNSPFRRNRGHS